jgi:glycerol-3-phosphate dehydrogenase
VSGLELAGCGKNAAALAAAAAQAAGPNLAGAAAGRVFAEVQDYARRCGGRPETFAGLGGAGDLVATVMAEGSRNRRAGELLARGVPAGEVGDVLGQTAEAVDAVPLLSGALHRAEIPAPAVDALAGLIAGELPPERWCDAIASSPSRGRGRVRAA